MAAQEELVRIVHTGAGLAVGRGLPGRGAWLCRRSSECLERAAARHGLTRALRAPVTPEMVDRLRAELGR